MINDAYSHELKSHSAGVCRRVCDCLHATEFLSSPSETNHWVGLPVQTRDKNLEFPNTNPYAVIEQHSCDQKQHHVFRFIQLKKQGYET